VAYYRETELLILVLKGKSYKKGSTKTKIDKNQVVKKQMFNKNSFNYCFLPVF
tara:strand:+ start:219 stop:377 length:159 start_codon:yes stop_codon:yes gene_type:complete